jgi:hypothetical protein
MKQWSLLQDEARPPITKLAMSESADNSATPVQHAPNKPHLVKCNFLAFLVLNCVLKGQKFGSEREIMQATGYNPTQDVREWPIVWGVKWVELQSVQLVNGVTLKRRLCLTSGVVSLLFKRVIHSITSHKTIFRL